jgi:hypothetical protein
MASNPIVKLDQRSIELGDHTHHKPAKRDHFNRSSRYALPAAEWVGTAALRTNKRRSSRPASV